ncbi:MAG: LptF/LptG family permease [Chitinophagaceae bacterium]|nr:LptF/LptG family permease [Chitinophagaceae bacterium]
MFTKLDRLILKAFIGPFIATFLLAIFVLILQFFWLWIDDFVGKGIDTPTLLKVILYVAGSWVPVALPLAMLISTIMTFGKLGETFELVAIKSAGISLLRFMQPIFWVSIFISGIAFLFNNNIIPVINLKLNKLKYEIVYTKPAFDIKPGVFYDKIEGFIIKLGAKEKDGQKIQDVVIYEKGNYLQDNLILADSGQMSVSEDKRFLNFDLRNGVRYEEKGMRSTINTELTRIHFSEYKKVFDLSSFFRVKTSDSLFKDNFRMLSMRQLEYYNDSIKKQRDDAMQNTLESVMKGFTFISHFEKGLTDTLKLNTGRKIDSIKQIIPDSAYLACWDMAFSNLTNYKGTLEYQYSTYKDKSKEIRKFDIEWQRKLALSFACFVLFLIGAPLGSIIRKGGIGAPLVFGINFFVVFHLLNTLGEKLAKEGVITPFGGMWLASLALLPVGIFLTYKALNDSQLMNKEFYYRVFKSIKKKTENFRNRKSAEQSGSNEDESLVSEKDQSEAEIQS